MKVKTTKDVRVLYDTIQHELGIDMETYKNDEVISNIVDMIVFPRYALLWGLRPVILAIILYFVGYFIIDISGYEYFLYGLFGFLFLLVIGLFGGATFLVYKIRKDIRNLIGYAFGILRSILGDLVLMKDSLVHKNIVEVLPLLFQGVIYIVMIPSLSVALDKKIPVVGRFVSWLSAKALDLVAHKIQFGQKMQAEEMALVNQEVNASRFMEGYIRVIDFTSNSLSTLVGTVLMIVMLPFLIPLILLVLWFVSFVNFLW